MSEQSLPTLPMWRVDHIEPSPEMLALRANGPIHRVRFPSGHEGWWVTGYDEAKAVLSDAAFRPAGMPPAAFTPDSVILGSPGWLVSHEGGRACPVTHDRGAGLQRPPGEAARAAGRSDRRAVV
ncbi:cytochrome P450 [Bradyrhizobium sp. USDA 4501]